MIFFDPCYSLEINTWRLKTALYAKDDVLMAHSLTSSKLFHLPAEEVLVRIEKFHMTWMVLLKGVTVSQCSYKVYMCQSSEVRFDDSVFAV